MPENVEEHRPLRQFVDWLRETSEGQTHADLTDALAELTEAVITVGKGGTLKLTISVKPAGRTSRSAVIVSDKIDISLPTADRAESIFFVDSDGNLCRDNPQQPRLPLEVVPTHLHRDVTELQEIGNDQ